MGKRKLDRPSSWKDCTMASFDVLKSIADGLSTAFVWPDEGEFRGETWHFNDAHAGAFDPLLLDRSTARMMLTLHDALNDQNQTKFREWVGKGRGEFGALWEMTMERVKIKGFAAIRSA
ncbi:hypothetical protein GA830_10440 [Mesorhizobium sp. NBSH29]|uniref:hypothetical protein n=1 Tax=Mesorhizobium sp. NBSH29 TaxID=2654249 RepID=UPI0018966F76|nr:hypothetical protein [Mesorhizobium sp. NBSH29]QPC87113.1 hypothetical protein GA830_10440 [Mesorhizobium sp. NBSH29]